MSDGVFNIAKGAVAEKVRDDDDVLEVLLMRANESESDLIDHAHSDELFSAQGNLEANFTNYARKTGITGTVTVDHVNNRVDVDMPDQTWADAGGTTNNELTKLLVAYREGLGGGNLIPLTHHDFVRTTDGGDIIVEFNAAGFYRAA